MVTEPIAESVPFSLKKEAVDQDERPSSQTLSPMTETLEEVLARYPDLEGIPAEVIMKVAMYGDDCTGGCG